MPGPPWADLAWVGPSSSLVYGQLHAWMQGAGYDDACVCRMDSVLSMFAAVRSGMGVAVLPCYLADAYPELTRPGDTVDDLAVDLWLLTHPDLGHAARVRTFLAGCCKNRNGLVVDAELTLVTGLAEREATLAMLDRRSAKSRRITLAADKAYDVEAFVGDLRQRKVTPHIAINGSVSKTGKVRKTAIDKRTTHHPGYGISLRCRKRIEEVFGWIKAQSGFAKVKVKGRPKVAAVFEGQPAAVGAVVDISSPHLQAALSRLSRLLTTSTAIR